MPIKSITPEAVFQLHEESGGLVLIDVRENDEFAEVSSALAENFPLSTFDPQSFAKTHDKTTPIYLICRSGRRSLRAGEQLQQLGFQSLFNVDGGMIAWESAGLPVVRGR
jgi:rhodanese-related sulfurtransferase